MSYLKTINCLRIFLFVVFLICYKANAQSPVYGHNFGTTSIAAYPYNVQPSTLNANLSNSSWTNSVGLWGSTTGASGEAIRLTTAAQATITLTFNVAANFQLDVTSFSFWNQRSNFGPQNWSMTINGIAVGNGLIGATGASTGNINVANPVSGLTGTITVVLTVSNPGGNGTVRLDDFTLNGSVTSNCVSALITSIHPATGPQNTLVTLLGSGFQAGSGVTSVKFNGIAAASFTVISDSEMQAYVPAGNASGLISVITNGCEGFSSGSFIKISSPPNVNYSADVYISEIHDVAGGDRGVFEIYNGTASAINLSTYSIRRYGNIGDTTPSFTYTLFGIIQPGTVMLFHVGNNGTHPTPCGLNDQGMILGAGFNANDEFELVKGNVVIDNAHAPNKAGYSMIRNSNAVAPKAVFNGSDWGILLSESCAGLGSHTPSSTPLPLVTQPVSKSICENTATSFSTSLSPSSGYTYQWKVVGITGVWSTILNNAQYSGATTSTLTINNAPLSFNKNQYYCQMTSASGTVISNASQLIVNVASLIPTFTAVAPICAGDVLAPLPTTSLNGITGSWSPALENTATTLYTFTPNVGQCASTATLTINVNTSTVPSFSTVVPICSGDVLAPLPTTSLNGITGSWSPALDNTATTIYTFTPNAGQCASTTTLTINVNTSTVPTFTAVAPICAGDVLATLPTTSLNGITGSWSPALDNTATTIYTFTPNAGQCASTTTLTINVNTSTVPTFTAVAPICSGDVLALLPTTSLNGITGIWSPALDNTATTTYTFTPNAGQCASTTTLTINVNAATLPSFTAVAPICSGDVLAPLPTTSLNGITGVWSPALDNMATTIYTFTPNAGQCASTTTLTINVNTATLPTFTAVAPICSGDVLAPLPTTSLNGITGIWSPALDNTATTVYTFTPNTGQCASTTTLTINANTSIVPTFTAVAPICSGDVLAPLPTTSLNGITGSWSPALDNTATTLYTFTPNVGQCASTATLTINVNTSTVPSFSTVVPICSGDVLAPLPTTSLNGITGSWSPALDNTATTIYTFTPNAGQCASTTTLTINVNTSTVPTFTAVAPICAGDVLATLPTTSLNGITGSWSPALDNTATTIYTFTPNAGQCASTTTLTINVNTSIVPSFTAVAPICSGDVLALLPTTSLNGITGSWSPALDNTATTTYTFTPNAGQCASTTTLTINVNTSTVPTFTAVTPICAGDVLAPLPTTSTNGIVGVWSPALDNTATTTYTFTPNAGQCASTATLTINVNTSIVPTFTAVTPICSGDVLAPLPTTSSNGISGIWSPALDNTATTTYTFTPNAGQCASTTTLTINVNTSTVPSFTAVTPICAGDVLAPLPTTSLNGITGSWSPALDNTATTIYTFTPNVGQCASTATLTINVNTSTVPSFTAVTPICAGDVLAPLPTTSSNGISGIWSPALDNTATTIYTFTPNAGQCASTMTLTINVNTGTNVIITGLGVVCDQQSIQLQSNVLSGIWNSSNKNVATVSSSGLVNAVSPGTTVVSFQSNGNCSGITTKQITVYGLPKPILKDGWLCIDNATGLVLNPVNLECGVPQLNHTFLWTFNGTTLPTTRNTHSAIMPGAYTVTVTNTITGCKETASAVVKTSSIAIAQSVVGHDFHLNQTITVTVTGGSGDYEFQLEDGPVQNSNVFTGSFEGEYEIFVRDKNGCDTLTLKVYALNYPPFFTPNGDGYNDLWNISGLRNQKGAIIYIFDRYGKLLTSIVPSRGSSGWDGTYNGKPLPSTDYWFRLIYQDRNGVGKEFNAHFSLKR